jgi:hypothetical protein
MLDIDHYGPLGEGFRGFDLLDGVVGLGDGVDVFEVVFSNLTNSVGVVFEVKVANSRGVTVGLDLDEDGEEE